MGGMGGDGELGGGLGEMRLPQMTKPELTTDLSVRHESVLLAVIRTLLGPERPRYRVLPM